MSVGFFSPFSASKTSNCLTVDQRLHPEQGPLLTCHDVRGRFSGRWSGSLSRSATKFTMASSAARWAAPRYMLVGLWSVTQWDWWDIAEKDPFFSIPKKIPIDPSSIWVLSQLGCTRKSDNHSDKQFMVVVIVVMITMIVVAAVVMMMNMIIMIAIILEKYWWWKSLHVIFRHLFSWFLGNPKAIASGIPTWLALNNTIFSKRNCIFEWIWSMVDFPADHERISSYLWLERFVCRL